MKYCLLLLTLFTVLACSKSEDACETENFGTLCINNRTRTTLDIEINKVVVTSLEPNGQYHAEVPSGEVQFGGSNILGETWNDTSFVVNCNITNVGLVQ